MALLPGPARVLVVRGLEVERGAGPRAGGRRGDDGVGPASIPRVWNAPSGLATSPSTSSSPRQSSRPSGTRLPGTCCRSTSARSCWPESVSRPSSRSPRPVWCAARGGSARDRRWPVRMAGMARVGDVRVGPAQSLRLRAHRPRRRPHGDAHSRAGCPASRRGAHAGVGHRLAARAVAASLVSPGDAARRLLGRAG